MKLQFVVLALWTLVLFVLLLAPIDGAKMPTLGGFRHWDKVAHSILFAITGFIGASGARFFGTLRARILFGMIFGLFLAVSTEGAQSLTSVRNTSFFDLVADVVGLSVALLFYALIYRKQALRQGSKG